MTGEAGAMVEARAFLKAAGQDLTMSRQAHEAKKIWATEEGAFERITRRRANNVRRVCVHSCGTVYH
jgi:hypothetical protein